MNTYFKHKFFDKFVPLNPAMFPDPENRRRCRQNLQYLEEAVSYYQEPVIIKNKNEWVLAKEMNLDKLVTLTGSTIISQQTNSTTIEYEYSTKSLQN